MPSPIAPPPLGAANVTLCVARLQDIALATAHGCLSAAERRRAQRITHRQTQEQFVRTRSLLRLLLADCTGLSPGSLALADADGAAPQLVGNPWGLHFSVSHSYDWAAVAVARFPVGIDIERIDAGRDWKAIPDILFHPDERQRLQQAPAGARAAMFYEIWTRKEAYLKGIGIGLSLEPASFHTLSPDGAVEGADVAAGWRTWPVHAPEGYAAALACSGAGLAAGRAAGRSVTPIVDRIDLDNLIRTKNPVGDLVCRRTHTI